MSATFWGPDFDELRVEDPEIASVVLGELERLRSGLQLIASENLTSPAVLAALGSALTNKYAEGYPGRRYYGGCAEVDRAEQIGIDRAKALFGAEHANLQPHSGASANLAAYAALVQPGDTVLAMDLPHGGHLTHGSTVNFSGRWFRTLGYTVRPDTELIDYDQVRDLALQHRPKMIICGATAYGHQLRERSNTASAPHRPQPVPRHRRHLGHGPSHRRRRTHPDTVHPANPSSPARHPLRRTQRLPRRHCRRQLHHRSHRINLVGRLPPAHVPEGPPWAKPLDAGQCRQPAPATAERNANGTQSRTSPALPAAETAGLITSWWFMRKGPWRIRYLPAQPHHCPVPVRGLLTHG